MNFFCSHQDPLFITQFTERMALHVTVTDTFPSPSIPTAYSRISVILLVASVLLLLMLLAEPSIGQLRTTRMRTRSLWFSWHFLHLPSHRKSLQRISPLKALLILFFCQYNNIIFPYWNSWYFTVKILEASLFAVLSCEAYKHYPLPHINHLQYPATPHNSDIVSPK